MAELHNTGHMSSKILQAIVQMIDVSVSRATWKGEEIGQIAQLREIFSEATSEAAKAEAEIAENIQKKNEEAASKDKKDK